MRILPTEVDLPGIAELLLTSAAAALGGSAPARRYRAAGFAVQDLAACDGCDSQLTISVTASSPSTGSGGAGSPSRTGNYLRAYTFTVELVRSVPTVAQDGSAPAVDLLDASGAAHIADYRTLDQWIRSLGFADKIVADLTALGGQSVAPGTLSTVGPSGGVVGLRATLTVNV